MFPKCQRYCNELATVITTQLSYHELQCDMVVNGTHVHAVTTGNMCTVQLSCHSAHG